jgi:acyl-[acyl-carrier-protein]-phospholipid O-acyltransferase/long-chain-fatty-acid--[acyl-carrier-protein] ligase
MPFAADREIEPLFPLPPLPDHWHSLGHAFIHQAKTRPQAQAISDSTGINLTYHQALVMVSALANLLDKDLGSAACVGILLPPSAAAALINVAITLLGRIPVNLNYTASKDVLDKSIRQCNIEQIISSGKVIERLKLEMTTSLLLVESLEARASALTRALAWAEATLVPEKYLSAFLPGLDDNFVGRLDYAPSPGSDNETTLKTRLDDPATVIFTGGSTGDPKGVLLTHRNILSDLFSIQQVAPVGSMEVVLGVLPFFHSFGFTLTLWAVLALGVKTVYHYNPFDARRIGKLCRTHGVTAAFCTPTIMRSYLKRCTSDDFKTMKYCVLGGEPLKQQLSDDIQKQLGILPLAGYGLAETSAALVSNLPDDVELPDGRVVAGNRLGTVGLPLPGTAIKIVDVETHAELSVGRQGIILAKGPQIMLGYLSNPIATAAIIKDGWLTTGDLGFLDGDGFLTITGRLSQFSKIGGEMVPHLAVEAEMLKVAGVSEESLAVTAIPDQARGERLVVLYCDQTIKPQEVQERLNASGISRLWVPDARDFIAVEALPVLANGKLDRRKIQDIARASHTHSSGEQTS